MSESPEESIDDVAPVPGPAPSPDDPAERTLPEDGTPESSPSEAPFSPPAPSADVERSIEALGDRLTRRLDAIQTILERESRAEATRERVVDRLHAELQEYKQDLLLKVQRPIFVDLIQLHDDIGKMIGARAVGETEDQADRTIAIRGILESIQVAIEDILYRQGVEPFVNEGDAFDPRRQRAVSTSTTDDPARNKSIAARIRKGFQAGDRPIRPELVSVFTFRPPAPGGLPTDALPG